MGPCDFEEFSTQSSSLVEFDYKLEITSVDGILLKL